MQFNASLNDCFHQVSTGGKYAKKVLIAMNDPNDFFTADEW